MLMKCSSPIKLLLVRAADGANLILYTAIFFAPEPLPTTAGGGGTCRRHPCATALLAVIAAACTTVGYQLRSKLLLIVPATCSLSQVVIPHD